MSSTPVWAARRFDTFTACCYFLTMFDESLLKDLIEMYGKCLSYKDIEAIGSYLFKDRGYDLHAVAGT